MSLEYGSDSLSRLTDALRSGVGAWGFSPEASVELLNVSENATFRLDDAGRKAAIRVHRPNYHDKDEILSELAWIEALRREEIVTTPAPIPASDGSLVRSLTLPDGETRFLVAFEFVPGSEPDSTSDLPRWFRELGALTARMHRHARSWQRPSSFARKTWDFDLMLGARPIWGAWQDGMGLDASSSALLARAVALLKARLERYGSTPDRFGLIHADLRLANLLVDGSTMRVIDFDDCGFSWYVYDFAAAVSFFEDDPIIPALADAWVEGYRTVAPLSAEEAAEIPTFVMLRRILLVAWIATHQHTPMGGETGLRYTANTLPMAEQFLSRYS